MSTDWTITLSDGVNEVPFDFVAHVEDADYSWSAEAVLRRQGDGELFFVTDCGCSCNGFGEYLTVADLQPIRRFEDALKLLDDPLDRERLKKSRDAREPEWR